MLLKKFLSTILVAVSTLFAGRLFAQMPNYMPAVQQAQMNFQFNSFMMRNMYFNYKGGATIGKHFFVVVMKDSSVLKVFGQIQPDSSQQYLEWKDKSVRRNDSGHIKKIYPYQTKELIRIDQNAPQLKGFSADTCWLFKAITGKITCYSPVADDDLIKAFISYIQKNNGPLVKMDPGNLEGMLRDNEKALTLFNKKKYERAIAIYNRSE